ncbi:hypothetical protein Trco_003638 [Trichoderma cornu-damae]|uniref:Uncharacterized protein n=1 Tax=Trichoderma cornu-damae TaxID=654480 RepID=A0A9P8QJ54_9HYPO|nr:hypothetical protein Trco_003638 [Trichoderma cornu-damae]
MIQRIHFGYWSQHTKEIDSFLSARPISGDFVDNEARYKRDHVSSGLFDATRAAEDDCSASELFGALCISIALRLN